MSSNNSFHDPQLAVPSRAAARRTTQKKNENDDSNIPPAVAASVAAAPTRLMSAEKKEKKAKKKRKERRRRMAAATGLENAPSDDDNVPVSPAQTAAAYEEMDAAIKESITATAFIGLENAPSGPVPPAQNVAAYEEMDAAVKESIENAPSDDDAPLHPTQIAAAYGEIDNAKSDATKTRKGKPELIEDDDAPLPAAMKAEAIVDVNESSYENYASKKPSASLANQGLRKGQDDATNTKICQHLWPIRDFDRGKMMSMFHYHLLSLK